MKGSLDRAGRRGHRLSSFWATLLAAVLLSSNAAAAAPSPSLSWAQLQRIEQRLMANEANILRLNNALAALEQDMARTTADAAVLSISRQKLLLKFGARLRVLNRLPRGARMLLLAQGQRHGGRVGEYLRRRRVLRRVARYDKAMHDALLAMAEQLEKLRRHQAVQEEHLMAARAEVRTTRAALAADRQARLAVRSGLSLASDSLWAEPAAALIALRKKISSLRPRGSPTLSRPRRGLRWPTSAGAAGQGREDRARGGVQILAAFGSPVQAIAGGKVVYSDWLAGYGQLVILDHGDGFHTMMGHLHSTAVTTGDDVGGGDLIGTVGETGSVSGTMLFFGIRRHGVAQPVRDYLR